MSWSATCASSTPGRPSPYKYMENHLYFPMFVDLTQKRAVVVGAGAIAARRVKALLPFAGRITVIAPEISSQIADLAEQGRIDLCNRRFEDRDLDQADIVLTATGDSALDADVAAACRLRRIPVNAASDKQLCDFYFPGIARRGNIVAGVTASGTDHRAAKEITEKIRAVLEEEKKEETP